MTKSPEIDSQAQGISDGLRTLHNLLDKPVARNALDLSKNALTSDRYDVLSRLRQSLRQYLSRDGDLFYVGLLGHFSAGKSSTINSLLSAWDSDHERNTGLNPTDTTITLITQSKNSNSLLGVIREGHVTIRHQAVESPILESLVLADTPGTGDPQFIEEVARDFLPICDVILFLFSAASPLDKSDLPLLLELHKRLEFLPLHFVVTRADELRTDFSKPLNEENLDPVKKNLFLGEVVSRINVLLKPQVYTAEQFMLLDNKTGYNVAALADFLAGRCNSSSPQARVSMHLHKLHFYLVSAKELRGFFAEFLDTKLIELNKIVSSASRNIQRYHEIVQISNGNLTKAWLDHSASIGSARSSATERLRVVSNLPDEYSTFQSVIKKKNEVLAELGRDARYSANGVCAGIRSEVVAKLRDHFYAAQRAISDTPLPKLSASGLSFTSIRISQEFTNFDLFSPTMISRRSRRCNDLCESQAEALRDAAAQIKRAVKEADELRQLRSPFSDCESVLQIARESLLKDLNQFFQNVELYRSGVFSHTTKESISTLGIGQQLDSLESEFNEDDRAAFSADAVTKLFPGFTELAARATTDLTALSEKLRTLTDSSRLFRVEGPEDNYQAIVSAASTTKSALHDEMHTQLQSDVDRLCAEVSTNVANLVVNAKADYDEEMRAITAGRKRRYFSIAGLTALALVPVYFAYYHFHLPAPTSTLGAAALNVTSGLFVEVIALLVVKWRENFPKLAATKLEKSQVNLNEKIRASIEAELRSPQFSALNEVALISRLVQTYEYIFAATTEAWHSRATDSFRDLKAFSEDYSTLRVAYVAFIEEVSQQCAQYFTDASKNLAILNAVAKRIKERAIEPSFHLLDETQQQLEYVKKEVEAVQFS